MEGVGGAVRRRPGRGHRGLVVRQHRRGHQPGGAPGALDAVRRAEGRRERHPPRDRTARRLVIKYRIDGVLSHVASRAGERDRRAGHLAHQGHGGTRYRRAARAAGRPLQGARCSGRDIDFRVSIMPSIFGEDAVLRMLDKQARHRASAGLTLDRLGFAGATSSPRIRKLARRALRHAARHRADRQRQDHHAVRRDLRDQHTASTRSSPSRTRSSTSCRACCRSRSTRRRA